MRWTLHTFIQPARSTLSRAFLNRINAVFQQGLDDAMIDQDRCVTTDHWISRDAQHSIMGTKDAWISEHFIRKHEQTLKRQRHNCWNLRYFQSCFNIESYNQSMFYISFQIVLVRLLTIDNVWYLMQLFLSCFKKRAPPFISMKRMRKGSFDVNTRWFLTHVDFLRQPYHTLVKVTVFLD